MFGPFMIFRVYCNFHQIFHLMDSIKLLLIHDRHDSLNLWLDVLVLEAPENIQNYIELPTIVDLDSAFVRLFL